MARFAERLAASKRAKVVRERGEFDIAALAASVRPPMMPNAAFSWSLAEIVAARDAQMVGNFALPARLSESFNTDDALFTARQVRLAPVQSLDAEVAWGAGGSGKGDKIADEADALFGKKGIAVSPETVNTLRNHLVDHGVAFGAVGWNPRADGSRWDPILTAWPIEFVKWDSLCGCYVTRVDPMSRPPLDVLDMEMVNGSWTYSGKCSLLAANLEPIIHGNGRWVVFQKSEILPHRVDATLLPAALVWPAHAYANRDFRKGSASHGNAKVVGMLPDGTPLSDKDGNLTAEAAAFMQLVSAIASQDAPVGIKPFGASIDILANQSRMWEVFAELAASAEKAAARIYLGTDGVLGAQGGAPGVDISALFGVATSKTQSDLQCINRALNSGLIAPWTAINFGDDKLAPERSYVFPDPDEMRVREDFGKRNAAFLAAVKAAREGGLVVTQEWVDACAKRYGVPTLPVGAAPAVPAAPASPSTSAAAYPANPSPT